MRGRRLHGREHSTGHLEVFELRRTLRSATTTPTDTTCRPSLVEFTAPVFSTPTYLSFTAGVPSTQTITVISNPKSNLFVDDADGGTLTSNPDFTIIPTIGTPEFNTLRIAFNGNPTAPNQTYTLNVEAAIFALSKQTYTINVQNGLKITSPGILNATAGTPVNFLVTATGSPAPQLSIDPLALVDGLTFTDHGNGTATIAGVPTLPGEYQCLKADLSTGTTRPCGSSPATPAERSSSLSPSTWRRLRHGEHRAADRCDLHRGRRESGAADRERCDDTGILELLPGPERTVAHVAGQRDRQRRRSSARPRWERRVPSRPPRCRPRSVRAASLRCSR